MSIIIGQNLLWADLAFASVRIVYMCCAEQNSHLSGFVQVSSHQSIYPINETGDYSQRSLALVDTVD